jgi:hypothetical protein
MSELRLCFFEWGATAAPKEQNPLGEAWSRSAFSLSFKWLYRNRPEWSLWETIGKRNLYLMRACANIREETDKARPRTIWT